MRTRRSLDKLLDVTSLKSNASRRKKKENQPKLKQSSRNNKVSDTYKKTHLVGRRSSSNFVTYTQNGRLFYDIYTRCSPYVYLRGTDVGTSHMHSDNQLPSKTRSSNAENTNKREKKKNLPSSGSSSKHAKPICPKKHTLNVPTTKSVVIKRHPTKKTKKTSTKQIIERKLKRELGVDIVPTTFIREKRLASLNATAIMSAFSSDSLRSNRFRTPPTVRKDSATTIPCEDTALTGLSVQVSDESDDAVTEPMSLTPVVQVSLASVIDDSNLTPTVKPVKDVRKKITKKSGAIALSPTDDTLSSPTVESFHSHQVIPLGRDSFGVQQITHQVTFVNAPNANLPIPLPVLQAPILPSSCNVTLSESPNQISYLNTFNNAACISPVQVRPETPVWNSPYLYPFQLSHINPWQTVNRPYMTPQFIPQTLTYHTSGVLPPTIPILPTPVNQLLVPGSNGIQLAYPVIVPQDNCIPQLPAFMPFRFTQPMFPSAHWLQSNPALPPITIPPDSSSMFQQPSSIPIPTEQRLVTPDSNGSIICNSSILPSYPFIAPQLPNGFMNGSTSSLQNTSAQQSSILTPDEIISKPPDTTFSDSPNFQIPSLTPLITNPIQCSSPIRHVKTAYNPKVCFQSPIDGKIETKGKYSPSKSDKPQKVGKFVISTELRCDRPEKPSSVTDFWIWEGESFEKPVYFHSNDPPVTCQCYPGIRHSRDGMIIREKDSVLLCSGPDRSRPPHVAKITALYLDNKTGSKMMALLWYYRPEHLSGTVHNCVRNELLASKHCDTNPVDCIEDRAHVLTVHAYARFMAKSKYMQTAHPRPPLNKVVPQSSSHCLHHMTTADNGHVSPMDCEFCLEGAAPSNVFFCRAVYDYKLKRITRSPFLGSTLSSSSLLNTSVNRSQGNINPSSGTEGTTVTSGFRADLVNETRQDQRASIPPTLNNGDTTVSAADTIVFPDPIFPSPTTTITSNQPSASIEQSHAVSKNTPPSVDVDANVQVVINGTPEVEARSNTDIPCPAIPSSLSSTPIKMCNSVTETKVKPENGTTTIYTLSGKDLPEPEPSIQPSKADQHLSTSAVSSNNQSTTRPSQQPVQLDLRINSEPSKLVSLNTPLISQSQTVSTSSSLFWPVTPNLGSYDRSVLETSADLSVNWAEHGEQIALSLDCRSNDPNCCTNNPSTQLSNYTTTIPLPNLAEPSPLHPVPNPSLHYAVQHHGQDSHRLVML